MENKVLAERDTLLPGYVNIFSYSPCKGFDTDWL